MRLGAEGTWWHRWGLWNALSCISPTLGLHSHRKLNKNIAFNIPALPAFTQIPVQEKGGRRGTDTEGRISSSAQPHLLGGLCCWQPVTRVGLRAPVTGVIPPCPHARLISQPRHFCKSHGTLWKHNCFYFPILHVLCRVLLCSSEVNKSINSKHHLENILPARWEIAAACALPAINKCH